MESGGGGGGGGGGGLGWAVARKTNCCSSEAFRGAGKSQPVSRRDATRHGRLPSRSVLGGAVFVRSGGRLLQGAFCWPLAAFSECMCASGGAGAGRARKIT